ncbi:hypothetical protein CEXT_597361 [Caerostris extrusa]|uniref:Uncharacterized protein n=1 Tax=Caerostris extrusa TaxID=172846 RepID=A0AAV4PYU9_CAEEX|nr:hypothetical protein CEXT_597361 [Caerostris extrusa]
MITEKHLISDKEDDEPKIQHSTYMFMFRDSRRKKCFCSNSVVFNELAPQPAFDLRHLSSLPQPLLTTFSDRPHLYLFVLAPRWHDTTVLLFISRSWYWPLGLSGGVMALRLENMDTPDIEHTLKRITPQINEFLHYHVQAKGFMVTRIQSMAWCMKALNQKSLREATGLLTKVEGKKNEH